MTVESNINTLLVRLRERTGNLDSSSPNLRKALDRIGMLVVGMTKLNIRRLGIYDQGHLINAVGYKVLDADLEVGVYGIKYAKMNEFGGSFSERQRRAMFWAFGQRGGPKRAGKGVIVGSHWRPRPYLNPALLDSTPNILAILREALK